MKKTLPALLCVFMVIPGHCQFSTFIFDDFTDSVTRIDLSEKIIRNGIDAPVSAFELVSKTDNNELTYAAIHLGAKGIGNGGYSFDNGDYMTHTCIDYRFPQGIDRSSDDTIKIEFDAIFNAKSGSGESNRLVVFLIHSYPEEGPQVGDYLVMQDHPFGRPAYNVRILPGSYGMFMAYGGGAEEEGMFEIINNMYWLPGFSSAAGGGTIGQGDPYPVSSWNEVEEGIATVSTEVWKHYTIMLTAERLSVYLRDSNTEPSEDKLMLFMEMPEDGDLQQINQAHGTFANTLPPNYYWFEILNAMRFFWRAAGENDDFYLANVKASKSGERITTFAEFRSSLAKVNENDNTFNIRVDLFNESRHTATSVNVALVAGDSSVIDNFTTQTVTFAEGSNETQSVTLNITPDDDFENDTLKFELQNINGGNLSSLLDKNTAFTLIILDETTGIENPFANNLSIYPVPANDYLYIKAERKGPVDLEIYAVKGSKLIEINNYDYSAVSLDEIPDGIYMLKMKYANQTIIQKFSIRK